LILNPENLAILALFFPQKICCMNDFFKVVAKKKPLLTSGTNYNIRVIWGKKNS
jgi:hypothetical protein